MESTIASNHAGTTKMHRFEILKNEMENQLRERTFILITIRTFENDIINWLLQPGNCKVSHCVTVNEAGKNSRRAKTKLRQVDTLKSFLQ